MTSSPFRSSASLVLALLLAVTIGYLAGRIVTVLSQASVPLRIETDTRAAVPVFVIERIENDALIGTVQGEIRAVLPGKSDVLVLSGSVRIPVRGLSAAATISAPTGTHFVASKKGKKYYPLDSAGASQLSPNNLVYFSDSLAAEAAGYHR